MQLTIYACAFERFDRALIFKVNLH